MNITSKNGLAMLKEKNVETKDYAIVFVYDNGEEVCHTFPKLTLSNLSDVMKVAHKNEHIIKVEVLEYTKTTTISVRPFHCIDTRHEKLEPKRNRTSYLRTRNIR